MERLTQEAIEAIRKRATAAISCGVGSHYDAIMKQHVRTDIPKLLAEIDRLKYALEVIANSDGLLIEPAPLCTIEEAYDRCVETVTKTIYGGDSE